MYVIPTFFGLAPEHRRHEASAPLYRWSAYGSWPYGEMYVKP